MDRVYRIQYSVLLSKLGYTVAAMYAAKGELISMLTELNNSKAPSWIACNIVHNTQGKQKFTGFPF